MAPITGTGAGYRFQEWLRAQVRNEKRAPRFPQRAEDVAAYQAEVRRRLEAAAGKPPEYDPLDAAVHQVHRRDGYRIEAVSFNTFAGLRMTATAYVPDADGPVPGILAVHGHTAHGRRDPGEQRRCAALAKRGYFVLAVDCFGSGERSIILPGHYHGGLDAAALWLTGTSLFGIQIHENVRACDYLASRPEVDPDRLAISGASGGGNQSFYAGAWEPRFKAVVPVVSIGAYRKVVATGNCMCETPFALAGELEQYDLLALIAPRALLVMSAMQDAINFRFEDAEETVRQAARVWELLGVPERVAFRAFPTRHGYPQPMREACQGWFDRWLRGAPTHDPVPDPPVPVEDYATISCFPEAASPQVKTIRHYFVDRRAAVRAGSPSPAASDRDALRRLLKVDLDAPPLKSELHQGFGRGAGVGVGRTFHSEDGLVVPLYDVRSSYLMPADRVCIHVGGDKEQALHKPVLREALAQGWRVWTADLPGLGEATLPYEIGGEMGEAQHNAARACHLLGFTLAGLWIQVLQQLAVAARREGAAGVAVVASGRAATPVLIGAGLLAGVDRLVVENPLASFARGDAFSGVSMAAMVPGLLSLGDIPHLAALRAPAPLVVIAPTGPDGQVLPAAERIAAFRPVRDRYRDLGADGAFRLFGPEEQSGVAWAAVR